MANTTNWKAPGIVSDFKEIKQMSLALPTNSTMLSEDGQKQLVAMADKITSTLTKYNCKPTNQMQSFLHITKKEKGKYFMPVLGPWKGALERQFKECLLPHLDSLLD